jgi:serine/threonine-protein kinase
LVAREAGNVARAELAFVRAREEVAQKLTQQPKYAEALCVLGTIDAALNRKDDAIREGRLAVELLPVTKDSINGALVVQYLALIYAWTGEKALALDQLETAAKLPGYLSYGQVALDPLWDPLRDEPRFKIIVASLAPAARS